MTEAVLASSLKTALEGLQGPVGILGRPLWGSLAKVMHIAWGVVGATCRNPGGVLAKSWGHSWATALGNLGGSHANCLGDVSDFLGEFFQRFAKSLGDLCHLLAALLGDCSGKILVCRAFRGPAQVLWANSLGIC